MVSEKSYGYAIKKMFKQGRFEWTSLTHANLVIIIFFTNLTHTRKKIFRITNKKNLINHFQKQKEKVKPNMHTPRHLLWEPIDGGGVHQRRRDAERLVQFGALHAFPIIIVMVTVTIVTLPCSATIDSSSKGHASTHPRKGVHRRKRRHRERNETLESGKYWEICVVRVVMRVS